jgi:hypothetical protein
LVVDPLVGFMAEQKVFTPLKIGLLAVAIVYFAFALHSLFTLSWIGEWETMPQAIRTTIFVEDISATACLAFRFAAGIIALAAVVTYLTNKKLAKTTFYKLLRVIVIFEGVYWLGLATTAGYSVQALLRLISIHASISNLLNSLLLSAIPTVLEAIILPIFLFVLAFKLNPNKPLKGQINWAFITGTLYIVVFWLINTGEWISVIRRPNLGLQYLWTVLVDTGKYEFHPEHLVSFVATVAGLLALAIYAGYSTKKNWKSQSLQEIKVRQVGVILLCLGLYFVWNYFSWITFAGTVWNSWYAWFLGHNLDLWMIVLPLLALPLLFNRKSTTNSIE